MPDKQDFIDLANEAVTAADACRNDALTQDEKDAWTNAIAHLTQVIDIVSTPVAPPVEAPPTTPAEIPPTDTEVVGDTTDPTGSGGDTSDTSSTSKLPEPGSTPDPTNS